MKVITQILLTLWVFCGTIDAQPLFQGDGEREDWVGTYFQGRKMGFTRVQTRWNPEIIEVDSKVFFQIRSESIDQSTTISQRTRLSPDLSFWVFHYYRKSRVIGNRSKAGWQEIDWCTG